MGLNLATMVHQSARSDAGKPALLYDGGRMTYVSWTTSPTVWPSGWRRPASAAATGWPCSCPPFPSSSSLSWGS